MAVNRYDSSRLQKTRRSAQGFLRADARLTRTGILTYRRADGSTAREFRDPAEVFAPASLATADAGLPVTVGHPGLVTPENVKAVSVGHTRKDAAADGEFMAAEVEVKDAAAIAGIASGSLVELSCGYTCDLDETPGEYRGQRYDARQVNIRYNHVALLPPGAGRAGSDVRLRLDSGDAVLLDVSDTSDKLPNMAKIRMDGVEVEVTEAVAAHVDTLTKSKAEVDKLAGKLETELKVEKARADAASDPKALDAKVAARVELVSAAAKILGPDFKADGLSAREIHEKAVLKSDPTAKFDGRSDDFLAGQFSALCAVPADGRHPSLATVVPTRTAPIKQDAADEIDPEKAYAEAVTKRGQAWRNK